MPSIGSFLHRVRTVWAERPGIDWALAAVILGAHAAHSSLSDAASLLADIPGDRRKDIYTTAASISALIGGFGTAAISQYATANGRRMLEIRRRFGSSLRRNWSGTLTSMLMVSGICLVALILDNGKSPGGTGWLVELSLLLGSLRSVRLVWLFGILIDVADQDVTEPRRSPAVGIPRTRRSRNS